MNRLRQVLASLLMSGTALALASCTIRQYYVFPAPSIQEAEPESRSSNETLYINLDGLELSVSPGRLIVTREKAAIIPLPPFIETANDPDPISRPSPFTIEVRFYPWLEGYAFNPTNSYLASQDGMATPVSEYLGPIHRTEYPGPDVAFRRHYPCALSDSKDVAPTPNNASQEFVISPLSNAQHPQQDEGSLGRTGITCFWLAFDTEWIVDSTIDLSLRGLTLNGQPISIPPIAFNNGGAWVFGTYP